MLAEPLQVLTSARLDNKKRVVEMLKESRSRLEANLVSSGHTYAGTRLSSTHTLAGALNERTGGASYLPLLKETLALAEADYPTLQVRAAGPAAVFLGGRVGEGLDEAGYPALQVLHGGRTTTTLNRPCMLLLSIFPPFVLAACLAAFKQKQNRQGSSACVTPSSPRTAWSSTSAATRHLWPPPARPSPPSLPLSPVSTARKQGSERCGGRSGVRAVPREVRWA